MMAAPWDLPNEGVLGETTSGEGEDGEEVEVIGDSVKLRAIPLLEILLDLFDADRQHLGE